MDYLCFKSTYMARKDYQEMRRIEGANRAKNQRIGDFEIIDSVIAPIPREAYVSIEKSIAEMRKQIRL